jgi:hypothetical protein
VSTADATTTTAPGALSIPPYDPRPC